MRRTLLGALLLTAAAVASVPLQAQPPTRVMGAPYNNASRAFIDLMMPHHDMALMMTEHAVTAARNDAVKDLARKMAEAQRKEITELRAVRRALFGTDSARTNPMMRDMMQQMQRMMAMQPMRDSGAGRAMSDSMHMRRDSAAGGGQRAMMPTMMAGDVDRMFLGHMISHHEEGIDVSLLAEHSDAAVRVRQLAKKIREAQERDIAEMRRILATLPAAPPGNPKP